MESQTGHAVSAILVDRNIEGPSVMLWGTLATGGWLELLPMTMTRFADVGLAFDSSDRTVWRFAQEHGMLLLTDNRNRRGEDSLEQTIREENAITALPVLTIGNVARVVEQTYREQCVIRLVEIGLDLANYLGTCRENMVLWDVAIDHETSQVKDPLVCPSCGFTGKKTHHKQVSSIPVLTNYECQEQCKPKR